MKHQLYESAKRAMFLLLLYCAEVAMRHICDAVSFVHDNIRIRFFAKFHKPLSSITWQTRVGIERFFWSQLADKVGVTAIFRKIKNRPNRKISSIGILRM